MLDSRYRWTRYLTILGLLAGLMIVLPAHAETEYRIYATPQPLAPDAVGTLVATGEAPCPILLPVEIDGDRIILPLTTECPFIPPDPIAFRLEAMVGPLAEGTYTVDLVNNTNGFVFATTQLEVAEPSVELDFAPAVPTTRDRVLSNLSGFAACPLVTGIEIGAARIDVKMSFDCAATPGPPVSAFTIGAQLGRLPAGIYEVEVQDDGETVASRLLTVYEAPPVLAFEPAEPTTDDTFTAIAGIQRVVTCDPVESVSVGAFFLDVRLDGDCLLPTQPEPPPFFSTVEATFPALAAGSYRVRFLEGGQVLAQGPLTVRTGGGCTPSETTLCLQAGRFQVRALWTTPDLVVGPGHASPRTSDTGAFTFFNPDNVELVVKVLDACNTAFDSYWVFTAGLTNVAVELEVTDTLHGVSKVYTNTQGEDFQPILDTAAFRTCP